jgi:hypothetical protein
MLITYNPASPDSTKEIQYILDGSNKLNTIQGRNVIPLPKGLNPLEEVKGTFDPVNYNPITSLQQALGYSNSHGICAWVPDTVSYPNKASERTYFLNDVTNTYTINCLTSFTMFSVVICLVQFQDMGKTLAPVDLGSNIDLQLMVHVTRNRTGVNVSYSTPEDDGDLTISPQISSPHSNPFVFVTKPYVLQHTNPPVTTFQVTASWVKPPNTQIIIPYFGIMYNT